jgi:hypothetical protein
MVVPEERLVLIKGQTAPTLFLAQLHLQVAAAVVVEIQLMDSTAVRVAALQVMEVALLGLLALELPDREAMEARQVLLQIMVVAVAVALVQLEETDQVPMGEMAALEPHQAFLELLLLMLVVVVPQHI